MKVKMSCSYLFFFLVIVRDLSARSVPHLSVHISIPKCSCTEMPVYKFWNNFEYFLCIVPLVHWNLGKNWKQRPHSAVFWCSEHRLEVCVGSKKVSQTFRALSATGYYIELAFRKSGHCAFNIPAHVFSTLQEDSLIIIIIMGKR